ncbi:Na(+)-translocating NADH-quinone reductase subunit A [Denitromonas iodatirespirans]|uniref:Na(+)-translocating NADH-quinone reductase subunit A n=1 Tax=Denitromonas iodatirespirans TaxID=2795389 RepID=A0A944DA50_DENI1|nr:Na(+)-translocating NADH-quinone reductase subunit A [Denitromonas iodatirespirans]MBT0961557.1 Na(+)-translocating NADH-quinone reductase subunit A [Denitromonas iodatirespirans]
MHFRLQKGLDLPISGVPEQRIHEAVPVQHVAVVGVDYIDLKPTMRVAEGDRVKRGQALFEHKKLPGVCFTAPAGGEVVAIHRGARRALLSAVIRIDDAEEAVDFGAHDAAALAGLDRQQVVAQLCASGLWTTLRTRPFSKVPDPDNTPDAILVTAMDTNPLAADVALVVAQHPVDFQNGLTVLSHLTEGAVWVCASSGAKIALPDGVSQIKRADFDGPHPAGLPGTHIHFLTPVSERRSVWYVGAQDVIAIGKLFTTGQLHVERVVSLAGPVVKQPRLLRTRVGASLAELTEGMLKGGKNRVISGSVFGGRTARDALAYLGPFHQQVSCLKEGDDREFMHFMRAGVNKHSVMNIFISKLLGEKRLDMTTTTNGSPRAMVPIGNYEEVMPLDILPTQLLRYLVVGDTEMAQKLGALELDEDDLALCTYVCAGKYEYGPILRDTLARIEKEG